MAAQRQYATAGAFRTALEARLNERARRDGVDLHRLRRQVAFDRLLARMFDPSKSVRDGWVLKGGYALEMRFHMARSTKDLDLTVRTAQGAVVDSTSLRERLQLAASIELPDFFTFIVGEAMAELNQAPEASEMLRGLIDAIVLTPEEGQLRIELIGNLATMLTVAQQTKRSPESGDLIVPVQMVAGACNRRYLQLWSGAA